MVETGSVEAEAKPFGVDATDNDIIKSTDIGARKIISKDRSVEIIGEGEVASIIDNRPYLDLKNRPSYRKGAPETVFENTMTKGNGVV